MRERGGPKGWWRRVETAPLVRRVKRQVRQWRGTDVRSRVEVRCRVEHHGGWTLSPERIRGGGRAYCFGIGEDLELERVLATRFGMRVFAFDPTPWTAEWAARQAVPEGLRYVPLGVAGHDGRAVFLEPDRRTGSHSMLRHGAQTGRGTQVEVRRLPTILREMGHEGMDLLKLDVEGAEYEVIDDLAASAIRPEQLLVEFHHRFASVGKEKTEEALRALYALGYRIFHIAPSGREYGFILAGLATSGGGVAWGGEAQ